ncbi:MAG TPA: NAD-dependent epimerase/dehydratase family protein [Natronosporangium sp.]|nr:NAD-dependent epimerase/dehydratase family protein [Natronosporangium sp.]
MKTLAELTERMSRPTSGLVEDLKELDGDLIVLGAGGKLGPSLVQLALRGMAQAGRGDRVIAVSRFSQPGVAHALREAGAHVIEGDVASEDTLRSLPDAANVIYLVGAKFGTSGREHHTWATNTYLPGRVAERFAGARIVALSTGNVYPLVPVTSGGCDETVPPAPVGEYAMSCLGRERILAHFCERHGTPIALARLNYAVEMRYGVLVDIGRAVQSGQPVDVTMGHVNVVWQGYANTVILRLLRHAATPPFVLNIAGPETVSVRHVAETFGRLFGREARVVGEEASTALLSNAQRCHALFGYPDLPLGTLVDDTARWLAAGLPLLDKPTHFQRRDGVF